MKPVTRARYWLIHIYITQGLIVLRTTAHRALTTPIVMATCRFSHGMERRADGQKLDTDQS